MRFVVLTLALVACSPSALQVQARTADTIARAVNAALPLAVQAERDEGDRAITAAADRATAERELARIRTEWTPRWAAYRAFHGAHDTWAMGLEAAIAGTGQENTAYRALGAVMSTYCDLRRAAPSWGLPMVIPCPNEERGPDASGSGTQTPTDGGRP